MLSRCSKRAIRASDKLNFVGIVTHSPKGPRVVSESNLLQLKKSQQYVVFMRSLNFSHSTQFHYISGLEYF